MARVTVEDCLENVDNRFQLVLVATKRARQILLGGQPMVDVDKDKPTVTALREIAEGHVTRDILFEAPVEEQSLAEFTENLAENETDSSTADNDVVATEAVAVNSPAEEA